MTLRVSNLLAIAKCNSDVDAVDVGTTNANGRLHIRTGAAPTNCIDADSGTLLGTLNFSNPAFGAASDAAPGGQATAATITGDSSADATGTAGHFRVVNRDNTVVCQGSITVTSGGGDMELSDISIVSGEPIDITSFTYTQPE